MRKAKEEVAIELSLTSVDQPMDSNNFASRHAAKEEGHPKTVKNAGEDSESAHAPLTARLCYPMRYST